MLRVIEAPNTGLFVWKFFSFSIGYDILYIKYMFIEINQLNLTAYNVKQEL